MAIVLFLSALAVWRWVSFETPYGGDWAQYMAHARALAEGRPYAEIGYLFSPAAWLVGPPVYPPGLPLLLVPSVLLFGESTLVPRLLMHGFLGLFLWAVFRFFSTEGARGPALGMVALLGTGFLLSDAANVVGPDLGMCALTWLALLLGERTERWSVRGAALIAVLGAAAILFRIAAMPLVPAVLLWALIRWRRAGPLPWVVGAVWGATLVWVLVAFSPGGQASQALSAATVPGDGTAAAGLDRFLFRLTGRIGTYRQALSEMLLYPFPARFANHAYHLAAVPLIALGLWGWARPRWSRLAVVYGATTAGMLLTLPVWTGRYAWPLTPFAGYGLARGVSLVAGRLSGRADRGRWAVGAPVVVAVLAVGNAILDPLPRVRSDAEEWRAIGTYVEAVSRHPPVRVASNRPRVFSWYSRIPAAGLPLSSLEVFLAEAERLGLTHVVVSDQRTGELVYWRWVEWRDGNPAVFRPVAREGSIELYEIVLP